MPTLRERIGSSLARMLAPQEVRAGSVGFDRYGPSYQLDKPRWLDYNIGEYRKAYASQIAVYACVMARATAVSSAPVKVYREVKGDPLEQPDHPLRDLIAHPNPLQSESEFLLMTQVLMDATGFAAIEKVRNRAGQTVQLWHLRSDWLKEIKRSQRPSDWEYNVPGRREPIIIKAENIIVIAGGPSTDLGVIGMSPIAVALREVGIDTAMTDFLKLFIDQGGIPPYALVTPNSLPDQAAADWHRGLWQQAFGGFKNWHKIPILSAGMDVKKIGSSIDELAYPELRALTEAHICAVFRVPPIIAGIQAGIEASTYSNYEQARKAFFEDTVSALWARLDGAFTRGLLAEFSADPAFSLEFDTSNVPALQEDKHQLRQWAREALASGGMTLNQFQAAIGYPGFGKEGDVLFLPISVQPTRPEDLAFMADQVTEPPQPVPAALKGGEGDEGANQDTEDKAGEGADDEDSDRSQRDAGIQATEPRLHSHRVYSLPLETRASIVTANRRGVSRLTAKFTPRLRAMFRRQGKQIAEAYRKRDDLPLEQRDALQIPWDEIERETLRELNGLYEAAGRMAFIGAAKALDVGISWDVSNPLIRQTLNELALRVVGINQTTRKDVGEAIVAGIEEGLSTPQIAERLTGLFEETYRNRAMTIARTESQVSYNLATADAYRESGVVMAMQCHDNPDHTDSYGAPDGLTCAERDGTIADVDSVRLHILAEHPNGSLAVAPLLVRPLGE